MSNDLQTRDKQNQEVDSSEQYAINTIGDKALQSADYVVKESKRALEKAMGKRTIAPKSSDSRVSTSKRAWVDFCLWAPVRVGGCEWGNCCPGPAYWVYWEYRQLYRAAFAFGVIP